MPMNFGTAPPNTSGPPTGDDVDLVSTHQRLLIAAALRTKGTILELGCGWYSTPLLHEIARAQERRLFTVDNQKDWLPQFHELESEYHDLRKVGSWMDLYEDPRKFLRLAGEERIGLCFCDHGQPIEREYAVKFLRSYVDVWVFHDTEELLAYGYERTLPSFKYQFTDKSQKAFTTVASSTISHDVTKWGLIELRERGLTEDVT
jgi:hypothetical protein